MYVQTPLLFFSNHFTLSISSLLTFPVFPLLFSQNLYFFKSFTFILHFLYVSLHFQSKPLHYSFKTFLFELTVNCISNLHTVINKIMLNINFITSSNLGTQTHVLGSIQSILQVTKVFSLEDQRLFTKFTRKQLKWAGIDCEPCMLSFF